MQHELARTPRPPMPTSASCTPGRPERGGCRPRRRTIRSTVLMWCGSEVVRWCGGAVVRWRDDECRDCRPVSTKRMLVSITQAECTARTGVSRGHCWGAPARLKRVGANSTPSVSACAFSSRTGVNFHLPTMVVCTADHDIIRSHTRQPAGNLLPDFVRCLQLDTEQIQRHNHHTLALVAWQQHWWANRTCKHVSIHTQRRGAVLAGW